MNYPEWFKERYKTELEQPEPGRYWIRFEDVERLLEEFSAKEE